MKTTTQRIIKFRFYDKTEKKMKFFDSIWNMPDPDYDFDEIQQFTGLLDKSGKEIYEGDILNSRISVQVGWHQEKCQFRVFRKLQWAGFAFTQKSIKRLKVIGNIYEHGHLLNK